MVPIGALEEGGELVGDVVLIVFEGGGDGERREGEG